MQDFIFGTLSSLDSRVESVRQRTLGVDHGHRITPIVPQAGQKVSVSVNVSLRKSIGEVVCHLLEPQYEIVPMQLASTEWDTLNWQYYQVWQANLPGQPDGTVVRYKIEAIPADGTESISADHGATFSYLVGIAGQPAWAEEAIIYQVFPDRFNPGSNQKWNAVKNLDDIHGGTIRGITEKIEYIEDLGFNCLWLNPFFPDDTYHGYHAVDYFSINPRLGTAEEMHDLVNTAHKKGIRVLLDFVANHWGSQHPTFQEAQTDPDSEYRNWYYWNEWPHDYQTFFQVNDLPKINVDHPPARKHLLDAAKFWLTEFDFDGYRLDYALGPTLDFWVDFRKTVKSLKPNAWIFGEAVETPETQRNFRGKLDGCLDFLLLQAFRNTFATGTMSLAEFDAFLEKHERYLPRSFSRPSFLDNHDMDRFLWLANGDKRRLKLAAICQFTLTGQPILYYGTEVGLSQKQDMMLPGGKHDMAQARLPMLWGMDRDLELHNFFRWIIHFRRQHPVLWRGDRKVIHLDDHDGTYVYTRSDEEETILVALNLSNKNQELNVAGIAVELQPVSGRVILI